MRSRLHALGLRYKVASPLPFDRRRRADIYFSSARLYVFIDGCFWHGCPDHFVQPRRTSSSGPYKFSATRKRDADTNAHLTALGFEVVRFWEHSDPAFIAEKIREQYFLLVGTSVTS